MLDCVVEVGSVSGDFEGGTLFRKYKLAAKIMATVMLAKIINGVVFDCGDSCIVFFVLACLVVGFCFLGLPGDARSFERFPGVFLVLDRVLLDRVVLGLAKSCVMVWFTSLLVR